jgi:hypothetical protein
MKGWRPSAWPKLETGSGLVKRAYSCRTSDRLACLFQRSSVPGRMTRGSVGLGSLLALSQVPRPTGWANRAQASAIMKRRQPFLRCSNIRRRRKRRPGDRRWNPGRHATPALPRRLQPESSPPCVIPANAGIQSLGADKYPKARRGSFLGAVLRPAALDARLRGHGAVGSCQMLWGSA